MEPPSRGRVIFCDKRPDKDGTRGVIHRRNVATPPALSVRGNPNHSKPHEEKVDDALRTAAGASKLPRGDLPLDMPRKGPLREAPKQSSKNTGVVEETSKLLSRITTLPNCGAVTEHRNGVGASNTDVEERKKGERIKEELEKGIHDVNDDRNGNAALQPFSHYDVSGEPLGTPITRKNNSLQTLVLVNERGKDSNVNNLLLITERGKDNGVATKRLPFLLDDDKLSHRSFNDRKLSPVNEPLSSEKTKIIIPNISPHHAGTGLGKISTGLAPTYEETDEANVSIQTNTEITDEMPSIEGVGTNENADEGGTKLAKYEKYEEYAASTDSTPEPIAGNPGIAPGFQLPDAASSSQRCTPVADRRPPRIPVPESGDSADQLSPVYKNQQLPRRYSPADSTVSSAVTYNRYGIPDDARYALLSPAGMFHMSPATTPMGGIPLSPEHEVFRHLSESPSSNSRQGRRRSTLDLRQWKQGELLGQGSSAEVYKAMCGGQFLAVKKIRLTMGSTAATTREAENLRAEIELLKRLDHPRIVRYAGCLLEEGEFGPDLLIFLEYMPSGSLSSVLKKFGPYGLPLVKKYIRQILEGLAFLHSKGIVHRDVKGANVLVDHMGEAKLADFGACKQLDALHSTLSGNLVGEVKGSVFWMAPEMVIGTAGRRSDIWSAGCVVIEMLTARPPWTQNREANKWSLPQALQHIVESNETPPVPQNIDRKCGDFLEHCLVREHRKRPYAHKLLAHDFLRTEKKL